MTKLTAQQKANTRQGEKRRGSSNNFSPVRLNKTIFDEINEIIKIHGGTRKAALIDAFRALDEKQKKDHK